MSLLGFIRKLCLAERDPAPREASRLSPPLRELTASLSAGELCALDHFLGRYEIHRGWLNDLYALDGFLTCIVIGPGVVPAEEWMTSIFAHDFDAIDADVIEEHWPGIGRLHNMIAGGLSGEPASYRPLFETYPGLGRGDRQPLKAWCEGFMTASVLCDEQWESMLRQPRTTMWLYPIRECASEAEAGNRSTRRAAAKAARRGAFGTAQLKQAVLNIHDYWHPR